MMELYVAKSAGFCFGVKRGVDCVYKMLSKGKIYTYGPIIHNRFVTGDLESKGVRAVGSLEGVSGGTLLIRAHGVPRSVYRELEEKKIPYKDCTCPFVRKIQERVKSDYENGFEVIIIGSAAHPEIIGINGWCENSALIIENIEGAKNFEPEQGKNFSVVVQTTFRHEYFEEIINELKKKKINLSVHNTICSATRKRQDEAEEISKLVDRMIIFGDNISSNTKKLYEISKKNCEKVYLIETVRDLELNIFSADDKIGITAGASTPPAIIKEAVTVMSEELNAEMNTNKTFEEMLDESFVTLHTGDVVKGTVIGISNGEISVNLGYKSDGVVTRAEYSDDPNANPNADYQTGDEIEVYVVRVNDGDGNVLLSKKRLDAKKGYETLEEAFKSGEPIRGRIIEVVKGGLMALINGIKVFVPSSQISSRYVEDLSVFRGKEFNFTILEFDRQKRRIVAGRKALAVKEEKEQKEKIFDTLNVGDQIEGTVSRLADFGAFVDLGGVDGLIHISEMSWGRVKKAKDVVKEGDQVKVTVLKLDREKGKISLSLKDIASNPWNDVEEKYAIGSIVEGKVVRMVPFGAFIELEEGVDGLIHISQIAAKHVVKPDDELKIGETVKVKVTELDMANKKISLSKKEVDRADEAEESADFAEVQAEAKEEVKAEEAKIEEAVKEEAETVEE